MTSRLIQRLFLPLSDPACMFDSYAYAMFDGPTTESVSVENIVERSHEEAIKNGYLRLIILAANTCGKFTQ